MAHSCRVDETKLNKRINSYTKGESVRLLHIINPSSISLMAASVAFNGSLRARVASSCAIFLAALLSDFALWHS